jgi:hypothetical protein
VWKVCKLPRATRTYAAAGQRARWCVAVAVWCSGCGGSSCSSDGGDEHLLVYWTPQLLSYSSIERMKAVAFLVTGWLRPKDLDETGSTKLARSYANCSC